MTNEVTKQTPKRKELTFNVLVIQNGFITKHYQDIHTITDDLKNSLFFDNPYTLINHWNALNNPKQEQFSGKIYTLIKIERKRKSYS